MIRIKPLLFFFSLLAIYSCRTKPLPCAQLEADDLYMGSRVKVINCSNAETNVDFNKTDGITDRRYFDDTISYAYTRPGTYFMEIEFSRDGMRENMVLGLKIKAPSIKDIQGEWKLWSFEDREYLIYPGVEAANPFESNLEETYEVDASWDIRDSLIYPDPDFTFCLLCFGPERYTYFEDQAEMSVGSILSNVVYFDGDSMILDAGYGGDPFLIYMSRL